jgi:succinoglycan biosynthesis transport protein ExoP
MSQSDPDSKAGIPRQLFHAPTEAPAPFPPVRPGAPALRPQPPAPVSGGLQPLALLLALRRRWPLASAVGLALAAVAAVVAWFVTPPGQYTAQAQLYVPPPHPFLLRPAGEPPTDLLSHQRNQAALIKSHLVLSLALDNPDVARFNMSREPADLETLAENINVDFAVAPEILRITMSGKDPEKLVAVIGAITHAYLDEIVGSRAKARQQRLEMLAELHKKNEEKLRKARQAQEQIGKRAGHGDPRVRASMLGFLEQQIGMNERELLQTQADLRKAKQELASLRARQKKLPELPPDEQAVNDLLDTDPRIEKLSAAEQEARDKLARALEVARKDVPALDNYRRELDEAQRALAAARARLRPEVSKKVLASAQHTVRVNISLLEEKVGGLKETEDLLTPEVERLRQQLRDIPSNGDKLDLFRESLDTLEDLDRRIVAEQQALTIEEEAPVTVKVLEKPFIARAKSNNRRYMAMAAAAAAALGLTLFGFGWWEFRAQRIDDPEDVSRGVGFFVLGTLPPPRPVRRPGPRGADDVRVESANAVRTLLLSVTRACGARVLLVTSAGAGEGKTSLVYQLAVSLSRAGLRALIVDGDLRNPCVHARFGLPNRAGLAEALCGQADPAELTLATDVPGLSLLPAGRFDDTAVQALARGGARDVFAKLRGRHDLILVDSSPVLAVADALLLGQHVDAAVFSILHGVSRTPCLRLARKRLAVLGVPVLGAIVNGVRDEGADYRYPYRAREKAKLGTRTDEAKSSPR